MRNLRNKQGWECYWIYEIKCWGAFMVITMMDRVRVECRGRVRGARCPRVFGTVLHVQPLSVILSNISMAVQVFMQIKILLVIIEAWNLTLFPCFTYKHKVFFCTVLILLFRNVTLARSRSYQELFSILGNLQGQDIGLCY